MTFTKEEKHGAEATPPQMLHELLDPATFKSLTGHLPRAIPPVVIEDLTTETGLRMLAEDRETVEIVGSIHVRYRLPKELLVQNSHVSQALIDSLNRIPDPPCFTDVAEMEAQAAVARLEPELVDAATRSGTKEELEAQMLADFEALPWDEVRDTDTWNAKSPAFMRMEAALWRKWSCPEVAEKLEAAADEEDPRD